MKPTIALVQGDAAGIGPELMAKLLALPEIHEAANVLVLSDRRVFDAGCATAEQSLDVRQIEDLSEIDFDENSINLLDLGAPDPAEVTAGVANALTGSAVLTAYGSAIDYCMDGTTDGLCFMPFNKDALHQAGLGTEDETQWAKQRVGYSGRVSEFNVIDGMWNARVTSHIPLREVADALSIDGIVASIRLAEKTLKDAGFERPRIAVAALNPHAGDGGNMGREEIDIIAPAVQQAKQLQISVDGPFPSDTLYLKVRDGDYDCAVSMYHDQGQIAIKLLGFHMGVSTLSGLPFPMATPAHGTAFDIVGQNKANVEPSRRAFMMVAEMARNRKATEAAPTL